MNYAEIKYNDIANGAGVRTSLFVSGCTHRCENCFNKIAWDFNYGKPFTKDIQEKILESCNEGSVAGLSLLGGEPFEPENQESLIELLEAFKERYPNKTVWCYSGYTYEQLTGKVPGRCFTSNSKRMLDLIDVLVDGEFQQENHSIMLRFRGSSNQRLIDLNKTREKGELVMWVDKKLYAKHDI